MATQLLRDVQVEPLTVLDDVAGVADIGTGTELEARASDERADMTPAGRLGPVERLGDLRDAIRVHEVVREVAALPEHDRVRHVRCGVVEILRAKDRRAIGGERRGVAEVRAEECDVVPLVQPCGA